MIAFLDHQIKYMLTVLTIAGFDPSGGAGILADIKTFAALGCFGTAAITSITSQNTQGVYGAFHQTAGVIEAQIDPVAADFEIAAVKTGMLPTEEAILAAARAIERYRLSNVVVDPVIRSTSGYDLIDDVAMKCLIGHLFPLADVITPNMVEAGRLAGEEVSDLAGMMEAARRIREMSGHGAVLVKGGHLQGDAVDVLWDGREMIEFRSPKVETTSTHGTGCTLSAAIAAGLANGMELRDAVDRSKRYINEALRTAPGLGHGSGPLNHMVSVI